MTPEVHPSSRPSARAEVAAIVALLALAAVVRFTGANAELWYDEIAVLDEHVRRPVGHIVSQWAPLNHVMNSLLARASTAAFGEAPWTLRLPALLFGVAGVGAFHLVARQLWAPATALAGTFLFAISYHHVHYSQDARGYTALVFFLLAATAALLPLLRAERSRPAGRLGAAYGLSVGLGLYAVLVMIPVAIGHATVLCATRRWRALAWLAGGAALALVLYTPMFPEMRGYREQLVAGALGRGRRAESIALEPLARELRPLAPLLAAGVVFVPLTLGRIAVRDPRAAAALALPFAAAVVINVLVPLRAWGGYGVHPRYLMVGLPLVYFCLTEALDWLGRRSRAVATAAVLAVTVASLAAIAHAAFVPKQAFREALAWMAAHRADGEARLGFAAGGRAARFYDPTLPVAMGDPDLQRWLEDAKSPTWVLFTFPNQLRYDAPAVAEWLRTDTVPEATFPGMIGDGDVRVHLWRPRSDGK